MTNKPHSKTTRGKSPDLSWDLIRSFLALERHGEYSLAAEMEGLDDSTLRRRIQTLERALGRTLFVRTEKGWKVSPDMEALVKAAYGMEEAARQFTRSRLEEEGTVRISMMDAFAERFSDTFARFGEKYPRLVLNLSTEAHFVNLQQERVDIALRLARPTQGPSSLRITKIGDVPINAYASQCYLAQPGQNGSNALHRILAMDVAFAHEDHHFAYARSDYTEFGLKGEVSGLFDSFSLLARMCILGRGVAVMPTALARQYPQLQKVAPDRSDVETELWMISHFNLRAAWQQDLADMLRHNLQAWQTARPPTV